jgi:hydroxypyruvate reductase
MTIAMDRLELRPQALEIFNYALEMSRVGAAMERHVVIAGGAMEVDDHRYVLQEYGRVVVVAIGKAAGSMAEALLKRVGNDSGRFEGIVAGFSQAGSLPKNFRSYPGGHPTPNEDSFRAATDILQTLNGLNDRDLVIFLVSGGGSSMVEQFLDAGISVDAMAATHKALVECGAPITAMNAVRKHLSAVKGGQLAMAAAPAEQMTIFVSDVPAGELDALASGPTLADRSTVADVRRIVAEYGLSERLPAAVAELLSSSELKETPKPGDPIFARSRWSVLLDSISLEKAGRDRAEELGWRVEIDNRCDDWSAEDAAQYLVNRVTGLRRAGPVCLLSAGEVTVRVPRLANGRGGRNQHFCLLCSELIAGKKITVLSGGSDGVDGNSPAAGAVVDGSTAERAEAMGYCVAAALEKFDSYGLLTRLGDDVTTGPTGNNLRDLRVLLMP